MIDFFSGFYEALRRFMASIKDRLDSPPAFLNDGLNI